MSAGRRVRAATAAWLAASLLVTSGCYYYAPAAAGGAPVDARVRATVRGSGMAPLTSVLGPNVRVVHGRVLADSGEVLQLQVNRIVTTDGTEVPMQGVTASMRREWLEEVATEQLARRRSWVAAGAVVAAVAIIGVSFSALGRQDDGPVVIRPDPQ